MRRTMNWKFCLSRRNRIKKHNPMYDMHYFLFAFVEAIEVKMRAKTFLTKNPFKHMKIADDFTHFELRFSARKLYAPKNLSHWHCEEQKKKWPK